MIKLCLTNRHKKCLKINIKRDRHVEMDSPWDQPLSPTDRSYLFHIIFHILSFYHIITLAHFHSFIISHQHIIILIILILNSSSNPKTLSPFISAQNVPIAMHRICHDFPSHVKLPRLFYTMSNYHIGAQTEHFHKKTSSQKNSFSLNSSLSRQTWWRLSLSIIWSRMSVTLRFLSSDSERWEWESYIQHSAKH